MQKLCSEQPANLGLSSWKRLQNVKNLFSESVMPDLLTTDVYVEQIPQEPKVNRYHRIR